MSQIFHFWVNHSLCVCFIAEKSNKCTKFDLDFCTLIVIACTHHITLIDVSLCHVAWPKPGMCLSSNRLKPFERVERAQTRVLLFSRRHCSVDKIRHVYTSPLLVVELFSLEYFV